MIEKGAWVGIIRTELEPGQRAERLPEDTRRLPFRLRNKGFLEHPAEIGDEVVVKTATGRRERGFLEFVNPVYPVDYGDFVPELLRIARQARARLAEEAEEAEDD